MSTLRSAPVDRCPGGDALVSLLYDDFEPGVDPSRELLEAHVLACATCLAEYEALGGVRAQLAAWIAPDVPLGFKVVRAAEPLTWRQRFAGWSSAARALPAAAAAVIVLGGAAALARLDVRYDQAGLTVRTGWGHSSGAPASTDDAAALRQELAALRGEVARLGTASAASVTATGGPLAGDPQPVAPVAVSASASATATPLTAAQGAALLRSFRQALDESEMRQQQNLQLRISEVTRDFDLQRRQDLVQIEQGFGRQETQRQQMLDYIRRVSLGQVPQQ
jgi:hypothetical protein